MKRLMFGVVAFLGCVMIVTGCGKKASIEQMNSGSTGFDSLSTTEELSQLPQQTTGSIPSQQAAVETLPIEASPVTPLVTPMASFPSVDNILSGSRQQQIQTALKNAGFYNGAIDGKIGPASHRAIEAFQRSNHLTVDGKVGPKTWAALEPYVTGQVSNAATVATGTEATIQ